MSIFNDSDNDSDSPELPPVVSLEELREAANALTPGRPWTVDPEWDTLTRVRSGIGALGTSQPMVLLFLVPVATGGVACGVAARPDLFDNMAAQPMTAALESRQRPSVLRMTRVMFQHGEHKHNWPACTLVGPEVGLDALGVLQIMRDLLAVPLSTGLDIGEA